LSKRPELPPSSDLIETEFIIFLCVHLPSGIFTRFAIVREICQDGDRAAEMNERFMIVIMSLSSIILWRIIIARTTELSAGYHSRNIEVEEIN
jgi:hypothetical protein